MLSLASCAMAADQKPDKKKPSVKAQEIAIPAGAVEVAPYTFHYTDPKGKAWVYRQTPFGISRTEDKPVLPDDAKKTQEAKDQLVQSTSAAEVGDSIRFVRNSPFGRTEWQKKKTDLNEVEQTVWNRELAKRGASESASQD